MEFVLGMQDSSGCRKWIQSVPGGNTGPVAEGCVGAGAGATVGTGSYYGGLRMKSGLGTASIRVGDFVIGPSSRRTPRATSWKRKGLSRRPPR